MMQSKPKVPIERPDRDAAARDPRPGAEDRPGFDLGGATGTSPAEGASTIPGGPKGGPAPGSAATGRASGVSDPSGSRSLGNRAGEPGSASGTGPTEGSGGPA
jgi:hypothetical protein